MIGMLETAASYGPKRALVLDEPDPKHGSEVADRLVMTTAEQCSDLDQETARIRASGRVLRLHKEKIMTKRKEKQQRRSMVLEPDAAGIDIGAEEIYVAVPPDRDEESTRRFSSFTGDLHALADWLGRCRIQTVAMESTGVYWIPLFQILEERGFKVYLVNAHYLKSVPGRKSDVSDCEWIQYLHSVGLLRASFRPPEAICALRTLWRHRGSLLEMAAEHILHMQKALSQMNLQLHHVLSDITGTSGQAILDAILSGQRDPVALAQLCHRRVQSPRDKVAQALVGDYRPEHLFTLKQCWRDTATTRS